MRRSNRRKEIIEIIEDNESSNDDNKIEEINQLSSEFFLLSKFLFSDDD